MVSKLLKMLIDAWATTITGYMLSKQYILPLGEGGNRG